MQDTPVAEIPMPRHANKSAPRRSCARREKRRRGYPPCGAEVLVRLAFVKYRSSRRLDGRFASMRNRTRDGPEERTRGDRKCHPEDQLWDETDHQVLAPKTRRTRISRGQNIVVGTPVASDGEEHDDG